MDESAENVIASTDFRSPSPRVRRRLVQATLFPHKPQENLAGEDFEKEEDHEDDDEEYCGSQTKKKKKPRKLKTTPKSRASKKIVVKETPIEGMCEEDSPVTNKSNFFVKVSERQHQKRQQKEQICVGSPENKTGSPENHDKASSPPDFKATMLYVDDVKSPRQRKRRSTATPEKRSTSATPEKRNTSDTPKKRRASATPQKRRMNSTPKKKATNSGIIEGCSGQMNNPTQAEHATLVLPDLRLEAKMKAEENSRIYGGRQIHPFFSSCKMVKRNQEKTDENYRSSVDQKDKSITLKPIHVFEQDMDDGFSPDWGEWFYPKRSDVINSDLKSEPSAISDRTVKSLHFDSFLNISGWKNDGSSDQCSITVDENIYMDKVDSVAVDVGCGQTSDVNRHDILFQEKMMSYGNDWVNQPENSLWTYKYQPVKANEICGNGQCVDFLNDWLRLWHEKGLGTSKTIGNKCSAQDADNCYTSESDSEDIDEENRLKNVLLITGPVGSGKSAAIYACAKEQGFQVIEVNASDWRNGALVKQRFGEAVESHWLQCSMENKETSDIKDFFKSSPASCNATASQESTNEGIELIPISDDENSDSTRTHVKSVSKENRTLSEQSGKKALILFEDVDATLCEDRGFIGTIQQLAVTAKRPMILTSNSNDPVLPNSLERLELCFSKPSLKELICLVSMVCSAENVTIPPCLMKRFIELCQWDIRKTILHLQFWCQGQSYRKDRKILGAPMVFDPDAGHNILPKIISSGYPSQLSEIVDKEIVKSLLEVEEASLLNEIDEEEPNVGDLTTPKFQPNSIDARKEAMLSWQFSDQDGNEFPAQLDTACEFSDSAGSPIAFGRRSVRRRTDTVLTSESGEECSGDGFPIVPGKFSEEKDIEANLEVISKAPSHCLAPEMSFNPLTDELPHSQGEKFRENCYSYAVTDDFAPLNGACRSVDVSHVPESSFVPETELFSDALSYGNVDNTAETTFRENGLQANGINLNISPSGLTDIPVFMRNDDNIITDSVRGVEEMADFHISDLPVNGFNLNISPKLYDIPILRRNDDDAITDSARELKEMADSHISGAETAITNYGFPVNGIDLNVSPSVLHEIPILLKDSRDTADAVQEEVADSQLECSRAAPREYQGMDECSRMNFSMRFKSKKNQSCLIASDVVQETWRKLRHCHMDLQQYASLEHEDASKVLKVAHGMSNLISEADMLLSDCPPLTYDNLEPSMVPCEKSHSLSWYDDHVMMVSTISEHGMCLYAKYNDAASKSIISAEGVDLAWEMLASSTNTMALGKLVNQDKRRIQSLEMSPPKSGISSQSASASCLSSIVQSIIPARSYLSVKGDALHEYLSSLSQISRIEASRLSESLNKSQKRRVRVARNYLTNAAPSLSAEDISLLSQYNCYQKVLCQSTVASLR